MVEEKDKRTPVFDWNAGEFLIDPQGRIVTVTEQEAVEQIVLKASLTTRGLFLIYGNLEDPDLNHKYGTDLPYLLKRYDLSADLRAEEMKQAVIDSIIYDPWIFQVNNVVLSPVQGTSDQEVSCMVRTIFEQEIEIKGVFLSG